MTNDVMEWRNSLYCVELNASRSIQELRVLIEGFEFHVYAHLSPIFTELLILRVCSSSSSASLLPIFILVLFSTFHSQNYVPLRLLFSRISNRVFF